MEVRTHYMFACVVPDEISIFFVVINSNFGSPFSKMVICVEKMQTCVHNIFACVVPDDLLKLFKFKN